MAGFMFGRQSRSNHCRPRCRHPGMALPAAFALAGLLAGCIAGPGRERVAPAVEFELRELQAAKLRAEAPIEIDNPWGDIRVRAHDLSGVIRVSAAIQRIGPNPPIGPTFRVNPDSDAYFLAVDVRDGRRTAGERNVRVDLDVYVPDGHALRLSTRDGAIRLKKTQAPVVARSGSGDISVLNDGPVKASTRHGSIEARPMRPGWGEFALAAGSGRVMLFLPEPERVDIRIDDAPAPPGAPEFERIGPNRWRHLPTSGDRTVDRVRIGAAGRVEVHPVQIEPGSLPVDSHRG